MSNVMPTSASDRDEAGRLAPRKNLFLMAMLMVGGANRAVRVRNLSASGALIEGLNLPPTGGSAILQRGSVHAECVLVWQADGHAGLRFANPITLRDWVPGASGDGQMRVDRTIAQTRATTATSSSPESAPGSFADIEPGLLGRTADELAFVSRRLEALGSDLASDPQVAMRHPASLQELDISMQILGHISSMLVAERPEELVKSIGMTELRRRLQRNSPI